MIAFINPGVIATSYLTNYPQENKLFKITRSKDADVIHYTLSLKEDGSLDPVDPVRIYWVKHTRGGVTEPLTRIQSRFSYGIRYFEISADRALFKFLSFDNQQFELRKSAKGDFRVYTHLNEQELEVEGIYVQFNGGTFLSPVISEVLIHGRDTLSGKVLLQNIRP